MREDIKGKRARKAHHDKWFSTARKSLLFYQTCSAKIFNMPRVAPPDLHHSYESSFLFFIFFGHTVRLLGS